MGITDKQLESYMALKWTFQLTAEAEQNGSTLWVVHVVEMPGICSDGATEDEALESVKEPMRMYIAGHLERGESFPLPKA